VLPRPGFFKEVEARSAIKVVLGIRSTRVDALNLGQHAVIYSLDLEFSTRGHWTARTVFIYAH